MKVLCYSSFAFSYLNRARVLYSTLRRFHPDWELVALITDEPPPGVQSHLARRGHRQVQGPEQPRVLVQVKLPVRAIDADPAGGAAHGRRAAVGHVVA